MLYANFTVTNRFSNNTVLQIQRIIGVHNFFAENGNFYLSQQMMTLKVKMNGTNIRYKKAATILAAMQLRDYKLGISITAEQ